MKEIAYKIAFYTFYRSGNFVRVVALYRKIILDLNRDVFYGKLITLYCNKTSTKCIVSLKFWYDTRCEIKHCLIRGLTFVKDKWEKGCSKYAKQNVFGCFDVLINVMVGFLEILVKGLLYTTTINFIFIP